MRQPRKQQAACEGAEGAAIEIPGSAEAAEVAAVAVEVASAADCSVGVDMSII